ncbi:MAG: azurin [Flavobacteriaceae bacterium]
MKNTFKSLALVALVAFMGACKDNSKNTVETTTAPAHQHEETVVEEDTRFSVVIEGNDQMQFNTKELKVPVGEPVVLTLKHTGKMAKNVMGHNFVLLQQGADFQSFAEKAAMAAATDYIPASEEGSVLVHTKVIGGGESDTVEFTLTEAGTYEFLCSFPGHYAMMRGVVIAE